MKVGALCAGYCGIELGLSQVLDVELAWHSEIDKHANKVMDHRFGTPNLGDLTQIDSPEQVDIVTAGFPCQPFSIAGNRKGTEDERWLIDTVCEIAAKAKAKWLILENVKGLLTANNRIALARVAEAMALNGFTRWEWTTLPASDIGAPHRRERWFCVAANPSENARAKPYFRNGKGYREEKRKHWTAKNDIKRFSFSGSSFEQYQPTIDRWANIIGRPAPDPYQNYRLNKWFVEWMMGLPEGHVCGDDLEIPTTYALNLMGNGVVPQQASAALKFLFENLMRQTCR